MNIDILQDQIAASISEKFPDYVVVEFYREDRQTLPTPAILLELVDFEPEPEENDGTERIPLRLNFEARIVIGFRSETAERAIRRMSAALAVFIHDNTFGTEAEPAVLTAASPDDFDAGFDRYLVWRLEWSHLAFLGQNVWDELSFPARVVVQLGQSVFDPSEPIDPQISEKAQPVLAAPHDEPGGDWHTVPVPESAGVLASSTPEIGPPHKEDYDPV